MDGDVHEAPSSVTGCCAGFGKTCPKCGGFMHMQPEYGNISYCCEDCDVD